MDEVPSLTLLTALRRAMTDRSAWRADDAPRTIQITTQKESHKLDNLPQNLSTTSLQSQFTPRCQTLSFLNSRPSHASRQRSPSEPRAEEALHTLLPTYTGKHKVRGGCERWDLCWSATLHIAGFLWVEGHRSCVCWSGWVTGAAWNETWHVDDTCFMTQICAILSLPALEPRMFAWWNVIMLCNSVRAVFVGVLITEGNVKTTISITPVLPRFHWCNLRNGGHWRSSHAFLNANELSVYVALRFFSRIEKFPQISRRFFWNLCFAWVTLNPLSGQNLAQQVHTFDRSAILLLHRRPGGRR